MNKLPHVTFAFWVMKICATTLGETAGDLLSMTLNIGYGLSSVLLIGFFIATLSGQLLSKRYHPFLYWLVILSTSTAGTTMSDYMDRTLELGYATGSAILLTSLLSLFTFWRWSGSPFSMKNIRSAKAETFYWAAILLSNTLGTALGDFMADSSGLGFGAATALTAGGIFLVILAKFITRIPNVILFWTAFVLTRPLGATLGDLLTKPYEKGGMDLGTIGSSIVLGTVLISLILWVSYQDKKREPSDCEIS